LKQEVSGRQNDAAGFLSTVGSHVRTVNSACNRERAVVELVTKPEGAVSVLLAQVEEVLGPSGEAVLQVKEGRKLIKESWGI
jgi:hypothetical protein